MKRLLILLFLLLGSATIASAKDSLKGWCEEGNRPVVTSGLNSTTRVQASHPSCTITVYVHGGGLATIFADNNGTPLANPFTAQSGGRWQAYSANGRYDVVMSSAGFSQTVTYSDIILCDPFETGSTCNNGGTVQGHNLLSTTHLDTIPFSPPTQGDIITAQAQTSPTGSNPSWARLPLGSLNFVLTSNGTDAVWAPVGGVSGCALPGTDTGVLSEHPVGTCLDGPNWTWNDGSGKQNMQAGLTNTVGGASQLTFNFGQSNNLCSTASVTNCSLVYVQGSSNSVEHSGNASDTFTAVWMHGRNGFMAGNITDSFILGGGATVPLGNSFDTDATSTIKNSMCLMQGCSQGSGGLNSFGASKITSVLMAGDGGNLTANGTTTGATAQDVFWVGFANTATVNDTSVISSIFKFGETLGLTVSGASSFQDYYGLGTSNISSGFSTQTAVGASTARFMIDVGFKNTLASSAAHNFLRNYMFGDNISLSASSADTLEMFGIGDALTLSNCSHCFLIGENGTTSTSNFIGIGLSATPELTVRAGSIKTNVPIIMDPSYLQQINTTVALLNTCNSGLKGAMDAVSDANSTVSGTTVVGGGSLSVQVYCNGTNWVVAGGGSGSATGITGSLTSGKIPVATGTTTLSDSSVSDDGTAPTRTPNGTNTALSGVYDEWVVDAGGVTANKLVCRSSNSKVQICATSITQGVIGVAQATATSGQTVKVCWAAKCSPISSNATTAGHWLIPSTSVAGDVDDTGSTTQPTGTDTFLAESTVGGGAQVLTTLLAADTVNANGGGKPNSIQINGSNVQPVTNFNGTTPSADANNQLLVYKSSNSGNTTSVSVEVPLATTGQAGIVQLAGALNGTSASPGLASPYNKLRCETGLGDGLNAIAAGTYLQFFCVNTSGSTWTITGINCWTDNAGTSTLNATNNAGTGLLTGAVTCNATKSGGGAAGTQSGTTTLANNDAISFTFVADGTSKQTTWTVSMTQ